MGAGYPDCAVMAIKEITVTYQQEGADFVSVYGDCFKKGNAQ